MDPWSLIHVLFYFLFRFRDALRTLEDQQQQCNDRLARLHHNLEVMMYQQRERDSNSNINRDMVLLVVLVVMIQALLNWVLTHKATQGQEFYGGGGPGGGGGGTT